MNWHLLTTEKANEIIKKNKNNETVTSLEDFVGILEKDETVEYENVVGQDSLTRFDQPKKHKNKNRNKNRNKTPRNAR